MVIHSNSRGRRHGLHLSLRRADRRGPPVLSNAATRSSNVALARTDTVPTAETMAAPCTVARSSAYLSNGEMLLYSARTFAAESGASFPAPGGDWANVTNYDLS